RNAVFSITFPTVVASADRVVEITGEAYFEVTSMKQKPFKVKAAGGAEIEVLGTHFNVNAYTDEPTLTATLLEGAIKFCKDGKDYLMQPGQQASVNKAGTVKIIADANRDAVA